MRGCVAFCGVFLVLFVRATPGLGKTSACEDCHVRETPGIVKDFNAGKMAKTLTCATCHGSGHSSAADAGKAKMPTPADCGKCHKKQLEQYQAGKHSLAWIAMKALPMVSHQPHAIIEGQKGCGGCHKIGLKEENELAPADYSYGMGSCDSCHTRHKFSVEEAKDPRACQTCHMGFDHPQWEMWSTSKHGTIWAIEGDTGRAPGCQTCHMPGGDHAVLTAWGFLALRLPEDDKEWLGYRMEILKALGVLDDAGNPTPRLDAVKGVRVARLSEEEWKAQREKMLFICSGCHSRTFAKQNLENADQVIKQGDKVFAEAIGIVKQLYKDGYLKKPEGWQFYPDLLQFYEAPTPIEQDLYLMFLEYRMRMFQGAFHMNPDYMHWYGWAPLKEALTRIRSEAENLRRTSS